MVLADTLQEQNPSAFSFDDVGNRTAMTDGLGSMSYEYSQLSQLTAETRSFNDTLSSAPLSNNSFKLQYAYNLSGALKSYTDAYGQQFNYVQDKVGRLSSVTGSTSFGSVTTYADSAQYRAFGALKHLEYGDDNSETNLTFNNRLQAATHTTTKSSTNRIDKEYYYLKTGEISFIDDKLNTSNFVSSSEWFDRSFKYDHLGRVTWAYTGEEARGGTDTNDHLPYSQELIYDRFGHAQWSGGKVWTNDYEPYSYAYLNNRNQGDTYDADGNLLAGAMNYVYDSAGQATFSVGMTVENTSWFDGDGEELKRLFKTRQDDQSAWQTPSKLTYFIKSSVMNGKVVNEIKSNGAKEKTYVYGAGAVVALQGYDGANNEHVNWEHWDASGKSLRYTSTTSVINLPAELEASGNDVGTYAPFTQPTVNKSSPNETQAALALMDTGGCQLDGIAADCSYALGLASRGGARQCPNNDCSARRIDGVWVVWGYTTIKDKRQPPTPKPGKKKPSKLPGPEEDEPKIYGDSRLNPWAQQNLQFTQYASGEDGAALGILKQFINRNPRCKEAMIAAAKARGLENYESFLDKVKFYDMTQEGMMDRKGFFEKPEETANSQKNIESAAGLAPPNTDNILLFNAYYRSVRPPNNPRPNVRRGDWIDGKGDILFHEFLHTYFNETHVQLIDTLGINPPKAPKDDKFGDYTEDELKQNSTARDALNSWINSGCAAVYTMRAGS